MGRSFVENLGFAWNDEEKLISVDSSNTERVDFEEMQGLTIPERGAT